MTTRRTFFWMGFLLLALGLALGSLYLFLGLDGFLGGMCSGASVMLMIIAAYIFARCIWWERSRGSAGNTGWLPSRDRNDWLPSRDRKDRP
ncbi:hypothetical protein OL239_11760 [Arthrobacter sp. ATA002]|uniref:hypothetical protein n=1 Tax=Arthrobacter sp. ATA002 TaxID=2991715 RepID=UPI0022A660BB|nr:hypothetical protein [Arthrobacter sp. ATA002]WAP50700.1 hypothetical protein OL239_11760 [Arthrobacter sp. ATA002]